jgi:excinuclease ABC subunit A
MQVIRIKGASQHNLRHISLDITRDRLVVITGVSGSGKSSLAFDTIYAEGQRRYVESLSAYARQFIGQMDKPDVESIEGLSPAIAIEQRAASHNPRSTVGTVTETRLPAPSFLPHRPFPTALPAAGKSAPRSNGCWTPSCPGRRVPD